MVSTRRLKPTAKNTVGGRTSLNSLIRNARTPDLDINGLLRTFAADIPAAARAYDLTSKVPREISSMLKAVLALKTPDRHTRERPAPRQQRSRSARAITSFDQGLLHWCGYLRLPTTYSSPGTGSSRQSPAILMRLMPVMLLSALKPNRRLAASPRGKTSFTT